MRFSSDLPGDEEQWLRAIRPAFWRKVGHAFHSGVFSQVVIVVAFVMSLTLSALQAWMNFRVWESLGLD